MPFGRAEVLVRPVEAGRRPLRIDATLDERSGYRIRVADHERGAAIDEAADRPQGLRQPTAAGHSRDRDSVRPEVLYVDDVGTPGHEAGERHRKRAGDRGMVDVDGVEPTAPKQAEGQGREEERQVVGGPPDARPAVAGVQEDAVDAHALHHFKLVWPQPVAGHDPAARVVRKAGDDLDLVAAALQGANEFHSLVDRLRVKPLRQEEYPPWQFASSPNHLHTDKVTTIRVAFRENSRRRSGSYCPEPPVPAGAFPVLERRARRVVLATGVQAFLCRRNRFAT